VLGAEGEQHHDLTAAMVGCSCCPYHCAHPLAFTSLDVVVVVGLLGPQESFEQFDNVLHRGRNMEKVIHRTNIAAP